MTVCKTKQAIAKWCLIALFTIAIVIINCLKKILDKKIFE